MLQTLRCFILITRHQTTAKIREPKVVVFFVVHSRKYDYNFNMYTNISNKK